MGRKRGEREEEKDDMGKVRDKGEEEEGREGRGGEGRRELRTHTHTLCMTGVLSASLSMGMEVACTHVWVQR